MVPAEPFFPYLCVFVPSFCLSFSNKQGRFSVVILLDFVIINYVSFVDPNSPALPLTLTGGLVSRIRMMSSAVRASTDKCLFFPQPNRNYDIVLVHVSRGTEREC